jgi:hypothetical protein
VSSCEKTTQQSVPWSFLFPSPVPPRKNHPQPTQKRLPIKTSPSDQGADSLGSPHLRINCADLTEDSRPGTNKRPRVSVINFLPGQRQSCVGSGRIHWRNLHVSFIHWVVRGSGMRFVYFESIKGGLKRRLIYWYR